MLTVLEPCDSEYRVRALLLRPRQGVTSLLIGDIRVPAAASYPQFRSLLFFLIYSLSLLSLSLSLPTPPTSLVLPLSLSFSPSLSLSLSLGSALISSRQQAPLVCISSGGAVQERPRVTVRQGERGREGERERESGSRRTRLMLHHGAASRHLGPSFFPMSTSVSLTGLIWALIS